MTLLPTQIAFRTHRHVFRQRLLQCSIIRSEIKHQASSPVFSSDEAVVVGKSTISNMLIFVNDPASFADCFSTSKRLCVDLQSIREPLHKTLQEMVLMMPSERKETRE
jgi:hypothetical protein